MEGIKLETVTFKGSRFSQLVEEVEQTYGKQYRIIEKTEKRIMPWFWMKEYVLRVQPESTTSKKVETVLQMIDQDDWRKQGAENVRGMIEQKSQKSLEEEVRKLQEKLQQTEEETIKQVNAVKEQHQQEFATKVEDMMKQIMHTVQTKPSDLFRGSDEWLLNHYYEHLQQVGVRSSYAEKLMHSAQRQLARGEWVEEKKVVEALKRVLGSEVKVTGGIQFDVNKVIALVGPTGVGKTTTIAKLAGMLTLQDKKVGLITTDTYRIGAPEQLQIYAELLGVEMLKVQDKEELDKALYQLKYQSEVDHILIDTVGRSPLAHESIEEIKQYLHIAEPDHIALVLPSTMTTENMEMAIENFERVSISSLIFTKLDEVVSHGILCNAVMGSKHRISYVTHGQKVPVDISSASSQSIANLIVGGSEG